MKDIEGFTMLPFPKAQATLRPNEKLELRVECSRLLQHPKLIITGDSCLSVEAFTVGRLCLFLRQDPAATAQAKADPRAFYTKTLAPIVEALPTWEARFDWFFDAPVGVTSETKQKLLSIPLMEWFFSPFGPVSIGLLDILNYQLERQIIPVGLVVGLSIQNRTDRPAFLTSATIQAFKGDQ